MRCGVRNQTISYDWGKFRWSSTLPLQCAPALSGLGVIWLASVTAELSCRGGKMWKSGRVEEWKEGERLLDGSGPAQEES